MSNIKVENTTYTKNTDTGSIVNHNNSEYLNARARRSKQQKDRNIINSLIIELNDLKSDMALMIQAVKEMKNGD